MIEAIRRPPTRAVLFTTLFSVLAGLLLPLVYLGSSLGSLRGVMATETEINADLISRVISANPELWRFETTRLEELLARRGHSGAPEIRRLFDGKGALMCESAERLPWPTVRIAHSVLDGDEAVGQIQVERSILPLLLRTALLSLVGLAAGLLLARVLPFRGMAEAVEQLHAANGFLAKIMEACTNAIVVLDKEGRTQLFNGQFRILTGRAGGPMKGLPVTGFFGERQRPRVEAELREVLAGRAGSPGFETQLEATGGEVRHVLFGALPLEVEGRVTGCVLSLLDITERKETEAGLRRMEEQIQHAQKMQSLGSLAGGVAHDMNNVLGAILGLASTHVEIQTPGTAVHQAFRTIAMAAERGGKVVKSLLSFARQKPVDARTLDLNKVLRDQASILELTTESKVRLELDLAEDLQPMVGDADALTNAVMNLCSNSMDAMDENGRLTLTTRNGQTGWIELEVEDTGTGMSPEVRARAMDPFFTTKEVGKGTGLGLSLVFSTVRAHHGQMDLQSEPGQGTRVILRFPARKGTEGPALKPSARLARKLSILLVDDDELIQTTLKMVLHLQGHTIQAATSGEAALAMVEEGFRPDAVILDLNMPGLGGAGTLPRLCVLLPGVPILLATGRADQTAQALVASHPQAALIAKPFAVGDLEQALSALGLGRPAEFPIS